MKQNQLAEFFATTVTSISINKPNKQKVTLFIFNEH